MDDFPEIEAIPQKYYHDSTTNLAHLQSPLNHRTSRMSKQPRTINHQRRTRNIPINCKIQQRLRIIPRPPRPSSRNAPVLHEMLLAPFTLINDRHLTRKIPRRQRIDPNLHARPLEVRSQLLRQRNARRLAGVVGELAVLALLRDPGHARDVDDGARFGIAMIARGDQERQEGGAAEVVRRDVYTVHQGPAVEVLVAEHLLGDLFDGSRGHALLAVVEARHASVVDEEVDEFLFRGDLADGRRDAVFLGHVHGESDDGAAARMLGFGFLEDVGAPACDVHFCAVGGEGVGSYEPETGAAAGYDTDPASDVEEGLHGVVSFFGHYVLGEVERV